MMKLSRRTFGELSTCIMDDGVPSRHPMRLSLILRLFFSKHRLRGGEARNRYAEWRTGDIGQACFLEEGDRCGIAAMFAADAELEIGPCLATALDRNLDELAHALLIDADEGIHRQKSLRC